MWQCFHVLQFDLYQQKYQQSAKVPHNLDFTKQFSIVKNKQKNEVKKKEKRLLMLLIAFNAFRQAETCTGRGIQSG